MRGKPKDQRCAVGETLGCNGDRDCLRTGSSAAASRREERGLRERDIPPSARRQVPSADQSDRRKLSRFCLSCSDSVWNIPITTLASEAS